MESNQLVPGKRYTLPSNPGYTGEFVKFDVNDYPLFNHITPSHDFYPSANNAGLYPFYMDERITEVPHQPAQLSITITATIPNQDNIGELVQLIILSLQQNTILDNIKVTVR